jgi:hypothetical protein
LRAPEPDEHPTTLREYLRKENYDAMQTTLTAAETGVTAVAPMVAESWLAVRAPSGPVPELLPPAVAAEETGGVAGKGLAEAAPAKPLPKAANDNDIPENAPTFTHVNDSLVVEGAAANTNDLPENVLRLQNPQQLVEEQANRAIQLAPTGTHGEGSATAPDIRASSTGKASGKQITPAQAPSSSIATASGATKASKSADWSALEAGAKKPMPRQQQGTFRSTTARSGNREVVVIEGRVSEQIPQEESLAHAVPTLPGEHATHMVGMQLGENLPEGIASGPAATFNLGPLKRVENATRAVYDRAMEAGAEVETQTVVRIEYESVAGEQVPIIVGIERRAWVRVPGADKVVEFVDYAADVDKNTRAVTTTRMDVNRPRR